jgi:predicted permease
MTEVPFPVRVAERVCVLLLWFYPRRFREANAQEMAADCATIARATYDRSGVRGLIFLLVRMAFDTARIGAREHRLDRADRKRRARRSHTVTGRRGEFLGTIAQDIRYAVRTLAKHPGFTMAAILTMALGIGANAAVFSVVNGVILQPLPYTDGSRLVILEQHGQPGTQQGFSPLEIRDYREQATNFEQVVEYHSLNFNLLGRGEPERVRSGVVSWNFFQTLGVQPLLGRVFLHEDDVPGAEPVLVLSHRYWMSSFGGDSTVVGQTVEMNDHIHTIVGVLPPVPHYPRENEVYMPTVACPFRSADSWAENRSARSISAFGRAREGVTPVQLQEELDAVAWGMHEEHAEDYAAFQNHRVNAVPLKEELTNAARPTLIILMGTVGLLLLIACANVANLMLSRLFRRERELAVRTALGASRGRITRQLITESTILTLVGGALGLLFAVGGLDLLIGFTERFTTRAREIDIDSSVLGFTLLIAVGCGIIFGSLPALPAGRNLGEALKDGSNRSAAASGKLRLRGALVVSQLTISFMVLIGAGLVVRSLWRLQSVDAGFEARSVLTMTLATPFNFDNTRHLNFKDGILERVRALPGVSAAALSSSFPLGANPANTAFDIVGRRAPEGEDLPRADMRFVTPSYFQAINQPILRGRDFEHADRIGAPPAAVVNEAWANDFFDGEDPLGAQIIIPNWLGEEAATIVGVVGNVRQTLNADVADEVYLSFLQIPFAFSRIVVSTTTAPMSLVRSVADAVHQVSPEVPVVDVQTYDEVRREALASPRLTASLLAMFAALALIITATGLAAVIGFSVSQRVHEIGVRMALGAERDTVLAMVLWQGMKLVLVGLVVGAAGAIALTKIMAGLLFGVSTSDPVTFIAVALMLALVAAAATLIPARRATAIDPMVALRAE